MSKSRKNLSTRDWLASLPTKRVATQVIITNIDHEVLLVKPKYRDEWLLPGGIVEADESPLAAAFREVKEELGHDLDYVNFAGVDYQKSDDYPDFMHVLFYGGLVSQPTIDTFRVEPDEIQEFKFCPTNQLQDFLHPFQAKRALEYLRGKGASMYLDNGVAMSELHDCNHKTVAFQTTQLAAGVLITNTDRQYLLVQEKQAGAYGKWQFPAGKVDFGETIEDAAVREVKEEVGLEVVLGERLHLWHESTSKPVVHTFAAMSWTGQLRPDSTELLDAKWFSKDQIYGMKVELRNPDVVLGSIDTYERRAQN